MAYIGAEPLPGQNREVDDISSGFNGSATAFTLQVSSTNVSPESANNILINLGGVLQNPGTDYTVAASTLTFTTAPAAGLSFFGLILGAGINTATVADQTIGTSKVLDNAITADKLADQAVTNAKVNNSAAIVGTKISPDFGSQNVVTTGTLGSGNLTVTSASPEINLVDSGDNPDYRIRNQDGTLRITDTTNNAGRFVLNSDGHIDVVGNLDVGAGLDVTGNITCTGTIPASQLTGALPAIDGSNLTGITGTTINNNADNRLITGSGTANTLNGEANLTFDGANLLLNSAGGNVLFGETTAYNSFENGSTNPKLQVRGTNLNGSCQAWIRATADGGAPKLFIANTRNTSSNGHTIVQNGDELGGLFFAGSDGSQFVNGASISATVTGTPGADDVPGALIFGTNAGAASTTEQMRIASDGFVTFGGDVDTGIKRSGGNTLQVHTNNTLCTEFSANQRVRMPQVFSTAGSSMRDVQCESDGTLACLTSITESKINIADVTDVSWLYNLKPKTFNFRKKTVDAVTGVNTYLDEAEDEKAYGLLAEDVETINKDFCFYDKDSEGNDVLKGVYYKTMVVPLLKAVQDLKAENIALTTRVAALEAA